jgi:hypothetical protein
MHGLRAWQHLLLSSPHVVTVFTDHKNLTYYRHAQRITRRVARYLGELADYHIILKHKLGAMNRADRLSRRPDYDTGEQDNQDIVVLPEKLFALATELLFLEQELWKAQETHKEQIKELQKEFMIDIVEEKAFYQGRLVVPNNEEIKRKVLQQCHDHGLAGHLGIANTILTVTREFWWPEVRKFATAYVRGCGVCQSSKAGTT